MRIYMKQMEREERLPHGGGSGGGLTGPSVATNQDIVDLAETHQ